MDLNISKKQYDHSIGNAAQQSQQLNKSVGNSTWNKLAILSVITGIIYFLLFIPKSLVWNNPELYGSTETIIYYTQLVVAGIAIGSGFWSYRQIKKSKERGKTISIIGIALGLYPIVFYLISILEILGFPIPIIDHLPI